MSVEQKERRKLCCLRIRPGRQDTAWLRPGWEAYSLPGTPASKLHKVQSQSAPPIFFFFSTLMDVPLQQPVILRKNDRRDKNCQSGIMDVSLTVFPCLLPRKWISCCGMVCGQWKTGDDEACSWKTQEEGGSRVSSFLSSCPCPYWQFALTANSSPSIHSLLTISLTTLPGHFQNDFNPRPNTWSFRFFYRKQNFRTSTMRGDF